MPKWDAENQAKLLRLLWVKLDIKVPADVLREIANEFGSDCTVKALTHQIAKFRNGAGKTGNDETAGTPKKRASPTKGSAKTSTKTSTIKGSKNAAVVEVDDDSDAEESPSKRVKTEVKTEIKTEDGIKYESDIDGEF